MLAEVYDDDVEGKELARICWLSSFVLGGKNEMPDEVFHFRQEFKTGNSSIFVAKASSTTNNQGFCVR